MATQAQIRKKTSSRPEGFRVNHIQGRYRQITIHQLALAWWMFSAKHITKRQLRVYFAAHEMAEKRRYTKPDPDTGRPKKSLYTIDEIKRLVGGRGSKAAEQSLSRDVKALAHLGLVIISKEAIEFAVCIDQIHLEDVTGFWDFFEQLPNTGRRLPMPRRTCRALAAGFPTAVMAMMIALMIRSLYWHRHRPRNKQEGIPNVSEFSGGGDYRVDGRTKCSWISEVFGVSRRSVTNARSRLIELGWITPIDSKQWELNKWGQRYRINVDWKPGDAHTAAVDGSGDSSVDQPVGEGGIVSEASEGENIGEIASPSRKYRTESASPCLNKSTPSEELKTSKPAPSRAGTAGISQKVFKNSRKTGVSPPSIRHITRQDLRETGRLLELHEQAVQHGLSNASEAARMDFIALAERSRAQANNPPAMFAWLLKHRRFDFITLADEDAACHRLREYRNGPRQTTSRDNHPLSGSKPHPVKLSDDDRFVLACIQVAKRRRDLDPSRIARQGKGWSSERWEAAYLAYTQKQFSSSRVHLKPMARHINKAHFHLRGGMIPCG